MLKIPVKIISVLWVTVQTWMWDYCIMLLWDMDGENTGDLVFNILDLNSP